MALTPYCTKCAGRHWASECEADELSTSHKKLSTQPKVLATVKEVVEHKRMSQYDRVKKWRKEHREEYNSRMREYRKANRTG